MTLHFTVISELHGKTLQNKYPARNSFKKNNNQRSKSIAIITHRNNVRKLTCNREIFNLTRKKNEKKNVSTLSEIVFVRLLAYGKWLFDVL